MEIMLLCAGMIIVPPLTLAAVGSIGSYCVIQNESALKRYISGNGSDQLPQITCKRCTELERDNPEIQARMSAIRARLAHEREQSKRQKERHQAAYMRHRMDHQLARVLEVDRHRSAQHPNLHVNGSFPATGFDAHSIHAPAQNPVMGERDW